MKIAIIDKNPRTQFTVGNEYPVWAINSDLPRKVRTHRPRWVFISSKVGMSTVREALRSTPETRSVYFYGDFRVTPPQYVVEFCGMTDMAMFTFKHPAYWSLSASPHVVRLGTNPDYFYRMPEVEKEFDVAFGGNYHGGSIRIETLRFLGKHYRLLVMGHSWDKTGIRSIGRKNLIKINRHFNSAMITVGIHNMNRHDGSIGTSYYTSNRLFQNMCVGVPHIAPYSPGVEEYFTSAYIDYRDHGELRKKIDWLLSLTQVERDAIGEMQREQIVKSHTHAHSWRYMENIIDNYDQGNK